MYKEAVKAAIIYWPNWEYFESERIAINIYTEQQV